jgi:hypothetical protein
MRVELPNGAFMDDVPDDATDEEIAQEAVRIGAATPEHFPPGTLDFDLSTTIGNIPSSAKNFAGNVVNAVTHPVGTAESIRDLGKAGLAHLSRGLGYKGDLPQEDLDRGDAVGAALKDRYGSIDAFKRTVMTDPVGAAADIAGLLSGGGALAAKIPGLTLAGKAAQFAGGLVDPLANATRAAKGMVQLGLNSRLLREAPLSIYQHGAEFKTPGRPGVLASDASRQLAGDALSRGIGLKSFDDLTAMLHEQGAKIGAAVGSVEGGGSRIPGQQAHVNVSKLFEGLDERRDALWPGLSGAKQRAKFDATVAAMKQEFGYDPNATHVPSSVLGPDGKPVLVPTVNADPLISVENLQDWKVDANKRLFGDKKMTPADYKKKAKQGDTEAGLQMVANAKKQLDAIIPEEYQAANREYGILKRISDAFPAVAEAANKAPMFNRREMFPGGAAAGMGYALGGPTGAAVLGGTALLASFIDNPRRLMAIGQALHKMQNYGPIDYLKPRSSAPLEALANELNKETNERTRKKLRALTE